MGKKFVAIGCSKTHKDGVWHCLSSSSLWPPDIAYNFKSSLSITTYCQSPMPWGEQHCQCCIGPPPPLPGPICSMYKRKKQHHACMFLTVTYCRIIHCLQNPNVQGKPLLILHGCSVFVFITKCSFHFATNFMLGISIIMHMYNCPQCLYNIYIRTCKRVFSIELFSNTWICTCQFRCFQALIQFTLWCMLSMHWVQQYGVWWNPITMQKVCWYSLLTLRWPQSLLYTITTISGISSWLEAVCLRLWGS